MSLLSRPVRTFLKFTSFNGIKSAHTRIRRSSAPEDAPDLAPDQTDQWIDVSGWILVVRCQYGVNAEGSIWNGYIIRIRLGIINLSLKKLNVETLCWELLICYEPCEQFAGAVFKNRKNQNNFNQPPLGMQIRATRCKVKVSSQIINHK